MAVKHDSGFQHIITGQPARAFATTDIDGQAFKLQDYAGKTLLLSFYRSPDCPLCSLRLYQLILAYPQLHAQGLEVAIIFEATKAVIQQYALKQQPPFRLIADPTRQVFQLYAVQHSWLGLRGVLRLGGYWQAWRKRVGGRMTTGVLDQLPADLLIDPDQKIRYAYYGKDIGDHLPLSEIQRILSATGVPSVAVR